MERRYNTTEDAENVLKEALWLAWVAAGRPAGMGVLQDRPGASKEEVYSRASNEGDYTFKHSKGLDLNADYVFGRMIKLRVKRPQGSVLVISNLPPSIDYQSWCIKYPSFTALFEQAEANTRVVAVATT